MSSFKLEPPKTIINRPPNKSLDDLVKEVETMQESPSFRSQFFCLIDKSREFYNGQNKLAYQNVADMFDVFLPVIKRAYANLIMKGKQGQMGGLLVRLMMKLKD